MIQRLSQVEPDDSPRIRTVGNRMFPSSKVACTDRRLIPSISRHKSVAYSPNSRGQLPNRSRTPTLRTSVTGILLVAEHPQIQSTPIP